MFGESNIQVMNVDNIKMKLDELFKVKGVRKNHAAKQLKVDPTTMSNWIKGRSYPDLNKAVKLAEILNCKVDDLYERTD